MPLLLALKARGSRALGADGFVRATGLLNDRVAVGSRTVLLIVACSDFVVLVYLLKPRNDIVHDLEGSQILQCELLGAFLLQARDLRFPQFDCRLYVLHRAVVAEAMPALKRVKAFFRKVLVANLAESSVRVRLVDWVL